MNEETPEQRFKAGKRFLKTKNLEKATRSFEKAYKTDKEHPAYMSYYGLCAALRWGQIGLGLELCTKAIKKEIHKPEYYVNLSRVYLASGNKKGALSVVKKGMRFGPDDDNLHEILVELGVRKQPVIGFLKRSNPINRLLGLIFRKIIPTLMKTKRPSKADEEDVDVGL